MRGNVYKGKEVFYCVQAGDGIRNAQESRGLGDGDKRQGVAFLV